MPTVDYKPIANGGGANVESQAQYLIDLGGGGSLANGFVSGVADEFQVNKVVRQSSMISAAVANVISAANTTDVLDDGNLTTLTAALLLAIQNIATGIIPSSFSTGDIKFTLKAVADAGWVMCNDGTISSGLGAGTTRANNDCLNLFTLLWNNISNTYAPVSGGRGISAAADWAANKTIALTTMLGRALAVAGIGAGLSSRALGQTLGEEVHTMTTGELVQHNHAVTDPGHAHSYTYKSTIGGSNAGGDPHSINDTTSTTGAATTGITLANTGTTTPFNVMQPTSFLNAMIKL